ncbi:type II toxin-antitoxin system VapC family toxin [Acidobacteriota bacterium]
MRKSSAVVVDASACVILVIGGSLADPIDRLWRGWLQDGTKLFAPSLWSYEITSALHRLFMQKVLNEERAESALEAALNLGVETVVPDTDFCRKAFTWATKLNHLASYDGSYLALAEALGVPIWTADKRLVNRSRQIGIDWVRWVGA